MAMQFRYHVVVVLDSFLVHRAMAEREEPRPREAGTKSYRMLVWQFGLRRSELSGLTGNAQALQSGEVLLIQIIVASNNITCGVIRHVIRYAM